MRFEQHRSAETVNLKRNCGFAVTGRRRLVAYAISAALAMAPQCGVAQGVTDVVLGSGSFQIPFNIAAGGSQPREVHLYMAPAVNVASTGADASNDMGPPPIAPGEWRLLDRQLPSVGQFQVSQTPDGTFWFATRTIDASGRPHPPGPIDPELKVTVDTTQPAVDLIADADADGKVTANFTVDDATGASQITVHYVTDTLQQWQTARVERTADGGRFAFEPTDQWQQLSLRLRVLDGAGNESIITKRLQKPRVAVAGSTRFASGPLGFGNPMNYGNAAATPNYGGMQPGSPAAINIAGNSPALPPPSTADQISQDFGRQMPAIEMLPNSSDSGTELVPAPAADAQTPAEAMRPLDASALLPSQPQPPAEPRTPTHTAPAPAPRSVPPAPTSVQRPVDRSVTSTATDNVAPQTPFVTEAIPAPSGHRPAPTQLNQPALPEIDENEPDNGPVPSPWSPIDSSRTRNPSREFSTKPTPRPVTPGELPLASRESTAPREQRRVPVSSTDPLDLERLAQRAVVRHSNSNQFSLDYEIEAIGGRGVDEIELYGTTDGGQTWKKWGSDPDRVSPFDIETNGEGIFGFQIVVVASNGLMSPRPLAGDVPDIVVVVDQTEPEVGISGAKYGEGDRAGSLVIAYHCEDRYLTSRPITLAFSDSPTGPWTTIAAGLRNIGDYVWPADPQLPRQIYLRIDATDQAGNVGGYVLEEPIDTRGLAPRARIRAFRSIPSR
ncbi:hypothetical protein [Aporhodopirellula aestuarii]|uniref:Secreted protein n=1 Tax=Aporhodopirellula aestuarii TaxID=2950107 RepID=A0ABT0UA20_9BACT|nr:hypothetical protein [Aporhodopirellula aestuarii]MCM2373715.1 hypothetical protein [Aporhodopirellula aestuarii]